MCNTYQSQYILMTASRLAYMSSEATFWKVCHFIINVYDKCVYKKA